MFEEQKADYVLITNNVVVADKNLISALVETGEMYKEAGFIIGKVYFHEKSDTFQTVGTQYDAVLWKRRTYWDYGERH